MERNRYFNIMKQAVCVCVRVCVCVCVCVQQSNTRGNLDDTNLYLNMIILVDVMGWFLFQTSHLYYYSKWSECFSVTLMNGITLFFPVRFQLKESKLPFTVCCHHNSWGNTSNNNSKEKANNKLRRCLWLMSDFWRLTELCMQDKQTIYLNMFTKVQE